MENLQEMNTIPKFYIEVSVRDWKGTPWKEWNSSKIPCIYFQKSTINIGRTRNNDLLHARHNCSKSQATVSIENGKLVITDEFSCGGTFVDNEKLFKNNRLLTESSEVCIGDITYQFRIVDSIPIGVTVDKSSVDVIERYASYGS